MYYTAECLRHLAKRDLQLALIAVLKDAVQQLHRIDRVFAEDFGHSVVMCSIFHESLISLISEYRSINIVLVALWHRPFIISYPGSMILVTRLMISRVVCWSRVSMYFTSPALALRSKVRI